MKSVGEAMAIGRTFQQAFAKAMRSRELDAPPRLRASRRATCWTRLETPDADRFDVLLEAFRRGATSDDDRARARRSTRGSCASCASWRSTPRRRSPASARTRRSTPARPSSRPRTPYYYSAGSAGAAHEVAAATARA